MRIIGGKFRSIRLEPDKKFKGRPTTDFAREALFSMLNSKFFFADVNFLDLFAGSGMIGFEAISRGVQYATAVEKDKIAIRGLYKNVGVLKVDNYEIYGGDALEFLKSNKESYSIIFADPPYEYTLYKELIDSVFAHNTLQESGWLIVEHDKKLSFTEHPNFKQEKKYGNVHFSVFCAPESPEE
ncbi:MAG: 16S rRNA (guanine(966)-N(2))-methyltransferase RsmD [Luteibaculaceae bacterium]